MFIVWGTYNIKRRLGRAAEFCRRCQDPKPFRFWKHRPVGHIYFIPLTWGKVSGYSSRCEVCKWEIAADPTTYTAFVKDHNAALDTLIEQTNPDLPQRVAQWQDLVNRAAEGNITDDERRALIYDRIAMHLSAIEKRAFQTHIDLQSTLALVASLALSPLLCLGMIYLDPNNDTMLWLGIAAGILPLACLIWLLATHARRFVRRKVLPVLAEELEPLNPTRDDLRVALLQIKLDRPKAGKLLKLEHLTAALERRMAEAEGSTLCPH